MLRSYLEYGVGALSIAGCMVVVLTLSGVIGTGVVRQRVEELARSECGLGPIRWPESYPGLLDPGITTGGKMVNINAQELVVSTTGLTKKYRSGTVALDNVSIGVQRGQ